jgi:2-alkyl-3-oxoalkanoate reductase
MTAFPPIPTNIDWQGASTSMQQSVLVTGGRGFLGRALCRALVQRGDRVRTLIRCRDAELESWGVSCELGDLQDAAAVERAAIGCATIFHVAAKAGVWGPAADYESSNVRGTEHLLAAARSAAVARLIYTSSPSVVYSGQNESGIDETTPYPTRYLANYPRTKAIAERMVLAANSPPLRTVALRPHLIWGVGDRHLLPRLIERARQGRLRQVGDGRQRVDTTYIDNAVHAHLCAEAALKQAESARQPPACAGRAYFIANDDPRPLWWLINAMLDAARLPPVQRRVSATTAYFAGAILELLYGSLNWSGEPPMTRFVARQLATEHWYDLTAAKRDLGYSPVVTVEEGLQRIRDALQHTDAEPHFDRGVHALPG